MRVPATRTLCAVSCCAALALVGHAHDADTYLHLLLQYEPAPELIAIYRQSLERSWRIDGGDGGRSEDDGAYFLLPYWMGRYHQLIVTERR